jgi:hypothetical protein
MFRCGDPSNVKHDECFETWRINTGLTPRGQVCRLRGRTLFAEQPLSKVKPLEFDQAKKVNALTTRVASCGGSMLNPSDSAKTFAFAIAVEPVEAALSLQLRGLRRPSLRSSCSKPICSSALLSVVAKTPCQIRG